MRFFGDFSVLSCFGIMALRKLEVTQAGVTVIDLDGLKMIMLYLLSLTILRLYFSWNPEFLSFLLLFGSPFAIFYRRFVHF